MNKPRSGFGNVSPRTLDEAVQIPETIVEAVEGLSHEFGAESRPQPMPPGSTERAHKPGPEPQEGKSTQCGVMGHLTWHCPTGFAHYSMDHGFLHYNPELKLGIDGMETMDCSFSQACTGPYLSRSIIDVQVGDHTLMAMVDTGCVQTLVHATVPLPPLAPSMPKKKKKKGSLC